MLKDSYSGIRQMVGSWDKGTVITVQLFNNPLANFLDKLRNMPDVEKVEVEDELTVSSTFSVYLKQVGVLPRLRPSHGEKVQITLKEITH